ncbi:hypothetical protein HOY34_09705 [Xinfangfangia sp. D13-10-4-6]|uniref:hypothetical protein n=1 Tax=Pseudogemmobacter hezensis TaxID=2737662 RepID=UPI0015550AA6|nr:hypothetical protein [Pseudogemmobacter hezensis]NPD15473.1 hypothetical protein [Pseudogemmobacter hezensis]
MNIQVSEVAAPQTLDRARAFFGDTLLVGLALIAGEQAPQMRVVSVSDRQPIRARESFSAEYQEIPANPRQKRTVQKVSGEIFGDDVTFKLASGPSRVFKVPLPDARKAGAQALRMQLPQLMALYYRDREQGFEETLYTLSAKRGFLALSPEIVFRVGEDIFRIDKTRATVSHAGETVLDLSREELRSQAGQAGYL